MNGAGFAVVVHDGGVVLDRDVLGAAVEVLNRVTAGLHDLHDEQIGIAHRPQRVIDETALDTCPRRGEARSCSSGIRLWMSRER